MEKRLLNIQQAAEYTGYAEATLYKLIHFREIPFIKLKRRVMFDILALDEWISEHAISPRINRDQ